MIDDSVELFGKLQVDWQWLILLMVEHPILYVPYMMCVLVIARYAAPVLVLIWYVILYVVAWIFMQIVAFKTRGRT